MNNLSHSDETTSLNTNPPTPAALTVLPGHVLPRSYPIEYTSTFQKTFCQGQFELPVSEIRIKDWWERIGRNAHEKAITDAERDFQRRTQEHQQRVQQIDEENLRIQEGNKLYEGSYLHALKVYEQAQTEYLNRIESLKRLRYQQHVEWPTRACESLREVLDDAIELHKKTIIPLLLNYQQTAIKELRSKTRTGLWFASLAAYGFSLYACPLFAFVPAIVSSTSWITMQLFFDSRFQELSNQCRFRAFWKRDWTNRFKKKHAPTGYSSPLSIVIDPDFDPEMVSQDDPKLIAFEKDEVPYAPSHQMPGSYVPLIPQPPTPVYIAPPRPSPSGGGRLKNPPVTTCPSKSAACVQKWHLPTTNRWRALVRFLHACSPSHATTEDGQDIEHVQHAYSLLRPGGRLVAVMSTGPFFRSDKKATAFRDWIGDVNADVEWLPDDAFKGQEAFRQTGVRTRLVAITK